MAAILQDYHNTDVDDGASNFGLLGGSLNFKGGQTFEASSDYSASSVKLLLYKIGTPGTITIELYAVDGSGFPTGSVLASGTTDGNALTTNTDGEWKEITFGSAYEVSLGITYVIVATAAGWNGSWRTEGTGTYDNGKAIFYSISSWGNLGATDFMFEVWGESAGGPPSDKVSYKRLVAVGNNTFYYEDI